MTQKFKQTLISEIPSGWEVVPILNLCDFERGTEPGSKSYNREKLGVPFFRVGNLAAKIQEQIYTTSKNIKLCNEDDILLTLDGSPGVVARGFEGAYSSGIRKIIVKQPNKLLKDFVYFILQAEFIQRIIEKYTTGVTIKHASKSLEYIRIPLPPLSEQKKIVYILDTIQEAVEVQDKIIEKTKELKRSLMHKLFREGTRGAKLKKTEIGEMPENWEVAKLGDKAISIIKYGKAHPKITGYIPVVGSGGIYAFVNTALIKKSTIVIGRKGTAGEVHLLLNPCWPSDTTFYLDLNLEKIEPKFLYTYMALHPISGEFAKTTLPSLTKIDLENFLIPLPPLPEQREIAEILQTVDQKIEVEQKKKALYEELFKSMLNQLMTGKIRVKDINF